MHDEINTLDEFIAAYPNAMMIDAKCVWERWHSMEPEGSESEADMWFCEDLAGNADDYNYQRPPCDDEFWDRADADAVVTYPGDDPDDPATIAAREKAAAGLANIL